MNRPMSLDYVKAATHWFGRHPDQLGASERKALQRAVERRTLIENPAQRLDAKTTLGQRVADRVALLGGSWTFIITFLTILVVYTVFNLALGMKAWDPYPFILLNLFLSMLAALQAPVIMMSQNRQDTKDRLRGELDFEVNKRAASDIQGLARKLNLLVDKIDDIDDSLRQRGTNVPLPGNQ